ncbi:hypothetical protein ABC255_17060 [Neobacillus sp. 3P2-tot-E-2]|uniref:hypothetical protein n=1 Tax=Neobacillus sp. 3P2-tot-E-2 TaxID=3132212 RepID=UPI0039A370E2
MRTVPKVPWEGACWINISTGTPIRNAEQERDTHNKNTIHDSGEEDNREVTPETKHNYSGIYMIYRDNFTSETMFRFI